MMMSSDILFWLAALHLEGIGPIGLRKAVDFFGHIQALFKASPSDWAEAGFTAHQQRSLKNPNWLQAEKDWAWCEKNQCQILLFDDLSYPSLLKEIVDAPLILFVWGNTALLSEIQIAVVGTRNPSAVGRELAESFSYQLATISLSITSGLAQGIDGASHRGALRANGGTIAVCGHGLNFVYPAQHRELAKTIREKGVLVSEFSPYVPPKAAHFPMRNRIISGLSVGVLVIEAALRSGSLITARLAADQGRDVFALPGSIHNPLAKGCHQLIRQGAKLVETADDILLEIQHLKNVLPPSLPSSQLPPLSGAPLKLFEQIGYEITSLDAIIIQSGLTIVEVSSMLLSLELEGYVISTQGGYVRNTLFNVKK